MSTIERTNLTSDLTNINPSNLAILSDPLHLKRVEKEEINANLLCCPICNGKIKHTRHYTRCVHHLFKINYYKVHYYYCYSCKIPHPSIPPGTLPNIPIGLDVIGYSAKLHVIGGLGFDKISYFLDKSHGIEISDEALRRNFNRFNICIQPALNLYDCYIQEFFNQQETSSMMFDESFFAGLYDQKICLQTFLIPENYVIAGLEVSCKRTKDFLLEKVQQIKDRVGPIDVWIMDLAPHYPAIFNQVFEGVSIQFCVFHFFQLLYRNIVHPLARTINNQWKEEKINMKKAIIKQIRELDNSLGHMFDEILDQISERLKWCFQRKWMYYLLIELKIFSKEINKRLLKLQQNILVNKLEKNKKDKLIEGLKRICEKIDLWITGMEKNRLLEEFHEVYLTMEALKSIFKSKTPDEYQEEIQIFFETIDKSSSENIQLIANYLRKYQNNLFLFLEKGVEKATSLIEALHQQLKKQTKNNRGGHLTESMTLFMDTLRFFKNIEPFKKKGESIDEKRSPMARLIETLNNPRNYDGTEEWYYWLPPMNYQFYRKQVKNQKELLKKNFQEYLDQKIQPKNKSVLIFEEKAKKRWENSKTLRKLENIISKENQLDKPKIPTKKEFNGWNPLDQLIFYLLLSFPAGFTRTELINILKKPRTTIYDAIIRLKLKNYIKEEIIPSGKRGRPITKFLAVPIPNG